jgi:hypothetical protein
MIAMTVWMPKKTVKSCSLVLENRTFFVVSFGGGDAGVYGGKRWTLSPPFFMH